MPEKGRVGSSAQSEEDGAAAKLQAVQRGRKERQQLEVIGQQLDKAATVMQARFRGKKARSHAANLHAEREVVRETSTAGVKRSKVNSTVLAVNDWQFGKVLGKGAYGEVYLATKKGSPDDPVAVKVLSRSILKRKRVGRFGSAYDSVMGEISVMKRLDHDNIVRLYEVIDDPDEDLLFMVMECVPGGDLAQPVEAKRHVSEEELRLWLTGLTLGLEHLHLCGVCHRDIKPENILFDKKTQQAKLSDFGISVFYKADVGVGGADYMQSTGGSYPFFAPEMCRALRGAGYSGRAADMWALGVCIFMWLYHRLPYESDSVVNLMEKIANDDVPYPTDTSRSPELMTMMRGLLDRRPKMRLRVRDLRRDPWLTQAGKAPLPPAVAAPDAMSAAKADLANAVKRVQLMRRADESMGPSAAPEDEPTGGDANTDAGLSAVMQESKEDIAAEAAAEAAEE